jgi:hypothetical protein
MIHLPIGKEYLELIIEDANLEYQLNKWYHFPKDIEFSCLGSVTITVSKFDYANNPSLPLVEWEGDSCLFQAKGCQGKIGNSDEIQLAVNYPFPVVFIEQFLRVVTAIQIFRNGGLFVHSAGLIRKGKGYLFSGYSGAGKTTICRVSQDCHVLNDDLVVLYPENDQWVIYSTPFSNPTQVPPGSGFGTLDMIVHLKQATTHSVRSVSIHEALTSFISHIPVVTSTFQFSSELFARCIGIIEKIEVKELSFTPDNGFWQLLDQ